MKKSILALAVISICGNAFALEVTWQTDPLSLVNPDNVKLDQYNEVEITYNPYSGGYVGDELPKYYSNYYSQENYTISSMECIASASLKEISLDMSLEYTRDQWVSDNAYYTGTYEWEKSNLISRIDNYIYLINNLDIESYKLNLQRQIEDLGIRRIQGQERIDYYIEARDEKYDYYHQQKLGRVENYQSSLDRNLEKKAEYESRDEEIPGSLLETILGYTRNVDDAQKALDEYTLDFHINYMNDPIQKYEGDKNRIDVDIEENELKLANAESYIADRITAHRNSLAPLEGKLAKYGDNVDDYIDNLYYEFLKTRARNKFNSFFQVGNKFNMNSNTNEEVNSFYPVLDSDQTATTWIESQLVDGNTIVTIPAGSIYHTYELVGCTQPIVSYDKYQELSEIESSKRGEYNNNHYTYLQSMEELGRTLQANYVSESNSSHSKVEELVTAYQDSSSEVAQLKDLLASLVDRISTLESRLDSQGSTGVSGSTGGSYEGILDRISTLESSESLENEALSPVWEGSDDSLPYNGDLSGYSMSMVADFTSYDLGACRSFDCRIISRAKGVKTQDHDWMISTILVQGEVRLRFRLKLNGDTKTLIADSGIIHTNTQMRAVATYDGTSMKLYLDGILVGLKQESGRITSSTLGQDTLIGVNDLEGNRQWDGVIDASIYDIALTQKDVDNL